MNASTDFQPLEANYSAAYGVYMVPRGEVNPNEKKKPAPTPKGLFSIRDPATWFTLEDAEAHCQKLNLMEDMRTNYRTVIARAMQPNEVCLDFDPKTDEQHAIAEQWVKTFKDARIERTVNGGYHVNFTYTYPGMFPHVLTTPQGLKIDVKRGYYQTAPGEFAGGSPLTLGDVVNDAPIAEITPRDYAQLTALIELCKLAASREANGFETTQTPTPREEAPQMGAALQIKRIQKDRPNLNAVLNETLDTESTLPGFSGVTGSEKLARIIADLWEVTRNEEDVLTVLTMSIAGQFENRTQSKKHTYRKDHTYAKFLADEVRRIIHKKQRHDAAKTAGVTMSLPNVVPIKKEKIKEITAQHSAALARRFKVINDKAQFTPEIVEPIIEDFTCVGLRSVIGAPGSGKSFEVLHEGCLVAQGSGYYGIHRINGGHVIYIAAEAATSLYIRFAAWKDKHNNNQPLPRFHIVDGEFNFMDLEHVQEIIDLAKQINDEDPNGDRVKMVVIDTFARTFRGNENNNGEMQSYVDNVERIAKELQCNLTVIHHTGKVNATTGYLDKTGRGGNALFGGADTSHYIAGVKDKNTKALTAVKLEVTKSKIGPEGATYTLPVRRVRAPESFLSRIVNEPTFTTQADPEIEALRGADMENRKYTLVLESMPLEISNPDQVATADEIKAAANQRRSPSNSEIVLAALRRGDTSERLTLEGVRAVINDYASVTGCDVGNLGNMISRTLDVTLNRMSKAGDILSEKVGKQTFYRVS
ncbi:AAA family ATPase [Salmonella enterica]|nr:AAA family ATPase [Salmonella enterica]